MPHSETWTKSPSATKDTNKNQFVPLVDAHAAGQCACHTTDNSPLGQFRRRQSQQSVLAKYAMQSSSQISELQRRTSDEDGSNDRVDQLRSHLDRTLSFNGVNGANGNGNGNGLTSHAPVDGGSDFKPPPTHLQPRSSMAAAIHGQLPAIPGVTATMARNDTPAPTAPNSPRMNGNHHSTLTDSLSIGLPVKTSGTSTPRVRPTTLDIPGLTKSKVSPDGRIAQRDVGAKLVIVMVGLPARGKSYITKKLARYLNWLQHDTRIFNVGERRRVVAGGPHSPERERSHTRSDRGLTLTGTSPPNIIDLLSLDSPVQPSAGNASNTASVAQIMLNGESMDVPATPQTSRDDHIPFFGEQHNEHDVDLHRPDMGEPQSPKLSRRKSPVPDPDVMEQNAEFFDPENQKASQIRDQVARETLDELLDFVVDGSGSVGILDATNSTMERRKMVMDRIRERAGPALNVLFLESRCVDQDLLEANMRLKLSGPDYKNMDPNIALADFKKRVQAYEKAYVPLGEYEEKHNMPYIQMIDVGRKVISHQIKGFLMAQANYYLLNFNLAPRQIWITRHGHSVDNDSGKIGGDSDLTPEGHEYAKCLAKFIGHQKQEWDMREIHRLENSHFPPQPGDVTPPNPYYQLQSPTSTSASASASDAGSNMTDSSEMEGYSPKNFCVWTSMLKRSVQTAQYFNDDEYDTKQMRMLDELNAGIMEGLTYKCIEESYPEEYAARKRDKLHYRYPGPGGEGYLDIINRLRPVIVELERMTDHVLLVGHRSVDRVLLAYFRGLDRNEVADLDVPIGMLYCLEPKPYGVDFKAYRWNRAAEWFDEQPEFKLQRERNDTS
ncbi:6-phosphofructo-2-kinase [Extremus antarcticus]|uniref:6-phosphofructo-2-kinase n=1 Tax=Extremus antarcticus TaxID=702011 RepID=A0AAJ0DJ57_9PEZI|nr:6-phosphofructo-2-kinase [Extremus antarcticus]